MSSYKNSNHRKVRNYYDKGANEYSDYSMGNRSTYSFDTRNSLDERDRYNKTNKSEYNCSVSYDEEYTKYNRTTPSHKKAKNNQDRNSFSGKVVGLVAAGIAIFILASYFSNGTFFSEANTAFHAMAEALSFNEHAVTPIPGISLAANDGQFSQFIDSPQSLTSVLNNQNPSVPTEPEIQTSETTFETESEIIVESETEPETSPVTEPETSPQEEPETLPQTSPVSQTETTVPESSTSVPETTTQYETDPEPVTFTVQFDLNDSQVVCSAPSSISGLSSGSKITAPAVPVDQNNNKTFDSWYKESSCTNIWDFDNDTVTANTTLYAGWKQIYTVTFEMNGGSSVDSQRILSGGKVTKPSDPTKTQYVFSGWFKDTSKTTNWDFDNDTVSADTTIYAGWKKICTITFNSDGGTEVASVTVVEDELITKPADPTKDKYVFTGWYTDADKTTIWDFDVDTVSDDMTLYAKWVNHVLSKSKLGSLTKTFTGKLVFGNEAGNSGKYDSGSIVGEANEYDGKVTVYEGAGSESGLVRYVLAEGSNQLGLPSDCSFLLDRYSAESVVFSDGQMDTFNVTNAYCMLGRNSNLKSADLSGLDTSNVTYMPAFFYQDILLTTIVWGNRFTTENATSLESFFNGCKVLTTIDLSSFDTSNCTNMKAMFLSCSAVTRLDLSSFNTSNVTNMSQMFVECKAMTMLDLSSFNTSNVTNMSQMFVECKAMTRLDLSSFDTSNVTSMDMMFRNSINLTEIIFSPSFNTGKVTTMAYMFDGLNNLVNLDLSSFDTSNVTNMLAMFYCCYSLQNLDLSGFDTSKVTTMAQMFFNCNSLQTLNVSSFDTSKVTTMSQMFLGCKALTSLDISSFDTTNVTTMYWMFTYCNQLSSLDVSGFNTENVTDMAVMFGDCLVIQSIDLTGLNTSKVTNMESMFIRCGELTELDLSSFDASSLTRCGQMFMHCGNLQKIYTTTDFDLTAKSDLLSGSMFGNCFALSGGAGTTFTNSIIDNTRACIDQGSVRRGYFTARTSTLGEGREISANAINCATPSNAVRAASPSDASN